MSDLKKWYLGGMVVVADKAEFKEDEHPRGKGGMFVKKGEGGGGSSALEEVYKNGGFKNPDALAKADFEELGKMDDSRLDAEITMLKGKVEEGGKPLDKARLEAAEGIMKGRGGKKVDTIGKEVDLSAKGLLVDAFKLGDSGVGGASHEKSAEMTLANWDTHSIADAEKLLGMYEKMDGDDGWRATMHSAIKTYIQDRKNLEKMDDVGLGKAMADAINGKDKVRQHMIGEEQNRRYADKVSKMDDKVKVPDREGVHEIIGKNDSVMDVEPLQMAKTLKDRVGKIEGGEYFVGGEKGNLNVVVTFDKGKENLVISKFEAKSGLGLVQKEYDKSGWVLFDIYDKKSLPSKIDASYMERDEVPLAKATEDGLKGISPITEKEASDYWYAGGFRKHLPLPHTYAVQKRMVNHLVLNMKHGIGTNVLSIPKRFVDYIASSPLGKHYSNKK